MTKVPSWSRPCLAFLDTFPTRSAMAPTGAPRDGIQRGWGLCTDVQGASSQGWCPDQTLPGTSSEDRAYLVCFPEIQEAHSSTRN